MAYPINSYQYGDFSEFGSGEPAYVAPPQSGVQLPSGYYFTNRSESNPAPAKPPGKATLKKSSDKPDKKKAKTSKPKAEPPVAESTDGGKTWLTPEQMNQPLESTDGGKTWAPAQAEQNPAPGYDTDRGLAIMDAVLQAYPQIMPEDAAAVAGNFLYESYGLPNIYEGQNPYTAGKNIPETGGFGLAQWTGPRRRALEAMPNPSSLETQMQYFQQENAGPERSAWESVLAAPDLPAKTRTFATQWERPGVPALDKRVGLSGGILDAYMQRANLQEMQRQNQILNSSPAMQYQTPEIFNPYSGTFAPPRMPIPVSFDASELIAPYGY